MSDFDDKYQLPRGREEIDLRVTQKPHLFRLPLPHARDVPQALDFARILLTIAIRC